MAAAAESEEDGREQRRIKKRKNPGPGQRQKILQRSKTN